MAFTKKGRVQQHLNELSRKFCKRCPVENACCVSSKVSGLPIGRAVVRNLKKKGVSVLKVGRFKNTHAVPGELWGTPFVLKTPSPTTLVFPDRRTQAPYGISLILPKGTHCPFLKIKSKESFCELFGSKDRSEVCCQFPIFVGKKIVVDSRCELVKDKAANKLLMQALEKFRKQGYEIVVRKGGWTS